MSVEAFCPPLGEVVSRWARAVGIDSNRLPSPEELDAGFGGVSVAGPCRPAVDSSQVAAWERRYGFRLPRALRAWLLLSDGLYREGPLIHPLTAIGPMIPFAKMSGLVVQPESWFELGNPNLETVCIDLGYEWPGGGSPIFTSGDDDRGSPPRLIAPSFEAWLVRLLREGGREFWFDPGFPSMGDPWLEHRSRAPVPALPDRLLAFLSRARPLLKPEADDRAIAAELGITRGDVETLFRHLQHVRPETNGEAPQDDPEPSMHET